MKFIRLTDDFVIRETAKDEFILFNWVKGDIYPLKNSQLLILKLCNGKNTSNEIISKTYRNTPPGFTREFLLEQLKNKIVSKTDKPSLRKVIKRLHKNIGQNLRFVQWEVSALCNQKCKHCYNKDFIFAKKGLSKEKCFKIVKQLDAVNNLGFQITGGEPLARKDIFELLEYIEQRMMNIRVIFSNAILLDGDKVKKINSLKSDLIYIISFDGPDPESYDFIRGPGQFKLFLKKIKKRIGINVMLHRKNIGKTTKILDFIEKNFPKADRVRIGTFNRNEQGSYRENKNIIGISLSEEVEAYKKILKEFYKRKMQKKHRLELSNFYKSAVENIGVLEFNPESHPCKYTGGLTFTIKSDGKLQWCPTMHQLVFGDINKISIEEAMKLKSFKRFSNLKIKDLPNCINCPLRILCGGGCRALVYPEITREDKSACFAINYFKNNVIPILPKGTRKILEDSLKKGEFKNFKK